MKTIKLSLWALLLPLLLPAQQTPDIQNIALFIHDRVEILDFAGPMEVFIAAGFNVYTVSETKEPIKAMGELTILPDYDLTDCPTPDMVAFFGGGGAYKVAQKPNVKAWMAEVFPQTDLQFSVCTGAFFLGEMGLLDGNTATTFHSAIPSLRSAFPEADVRDDVRFVDNGRVITTAGISAGIDGALHLVAKIKGMDRAVAVAENMEYTGWEPEKGLVLPSPILKEIEAHGIKAALKNADGEANLFQGELMNLGKRLSESGKNERALEIFEFALEKFQLSNKDCKIIHQSLTTAGRKAPPSQDEVVALMDQEKFEEIGKIIKTTKEKYPGWNYFSEGWANGFGYHLMNEQKMEQAIAVFKLNILAYPKSFNTYDSLGEAYMNAEEWDLATRYYKKSLVLNPDNDNGRKMLEKIEMLQGKKRIEK